MSDDVVIDCEDLFSMKQIENRAGRQAEEAFNDMMGHVFLQDWLKAGNGRVNDKYHLTIEAEDDET